MYSIWDAAGQRIDTVAFPDPLVPQEVGETVRQFVKPTVRVLLDDAILAKPTQGQMAGTRAACVAGYCFGYSGPDCPEAHPVRVALVPIFCSAANS